MKLIEKIYFDKMFYFKIKDKSFLICILILSYIVEQRFSLKNKGIFSRPRDLVGMVRLSASILQHQIKSEIGLVEGNS